MTHLPCPVSTCDRPRKGSDQICGACQEDLRRALEQVPELAAELDVTLSRQGSKTGGGTTEAEVDKTPATLRIGPMPYDGRASEAARALRVTLVGWVRVLQEVEEIHEGPACRLCAHLSCAYIPQPGNHLGSMALWLLRRFQRLVQHAAAVEICEEIVDAVRRAESVVDRPGERTYAGPCGECGADVYAKLGAALVVCPGCQWECGIAERKEWLLGQLHDRLATASEIAHIVTVLDVPLTPELVRRWASPRGPDKAAKLLARGTDTRGRPLYKVADARELLARKAAGKV